MYSISIIVPVYNVEMYVSRCIQSIMQQEDCKASLECIIVDDYSSDNSMMIIQSLIDNYNGGILFTILKHPINKGLSAARNTGIKAAQGDYIFFVDSDDWLPTDSLSKFVKVLLLHPNIDMIAGNSHNPIDNGSNQLIIPKMTFFNNYQIRKLLLNNQYISCYAWNKLIKSTIVTNNKFPEGIIYEDKYWTYFLFKDITQTIIIPDITYIYESNHPLSIVNTSKTPEKAPLYMKSICLFGNKLLNSPYADLYVDSLIYLLKYLIIALDLQNKYKVRDKECLQIRQLRKRIVMESFRNRRYFLALFIFILTYPPTSYMFNFAWVRKHYHIIDQTGRTIANFLERVHRILYPFH